MVGEQAVDTEPVEQAELGWGVAGGAEELGTGGVALAEVVRQEVVLLAEGPRVDLQAGPVGVPYQAGRVQQVPVGVARDDQALVGPDTVGVGGGLSKAAGGGTVHVGKPVTGDHDVVRPAG